MTKMTKSSLFAALCVLLVVQRAIGSGLTINMDILPQKRAYHIEARFNKDNDIEIEVKHPNNSSGIIVEISPFMKESWTRHGGLISNDRYDRVSSTVVFHYSRIMNGSHHSSNPCMQIDQTNDALCTFRLMLANVYWYEDYGRYSLFYARVQNSTVGVEPSVKLFGSSCFEGNGSETSQRNANEAYKIAENTTIGIDEGHNYNLWNSRTEDYGNPIISLTLYERYRSQSMKFQVKPKFYYFRDYNKLVEVFDNNTLASVNGSSLNLTSFGFSLDRNETSEMTLITTDIHTENNLIPVHFRDRFYYYTKALKQPEPEIKKVQQSPSRIHSLLTKAGGLVINKIFGKRQ